ncbi:Lipid phosphate phosphatase 1 [Chlorella vulgaris]
MTDRRELKIRRASSQLGISKSESVKLALPVQQQPPTLGRHFVRAHAAQYAVVIALIWLLALSERWTPFHHALYHNGDLEMWRYSYPLRQNHVPAWAVPCISVFTPVLCILGFAAVGRVGRVEVHHACLLLVACVASCGLVTNWIKINVGRPRPHFVHRCWPDGLPPAFTAEGLPDCAASAINPGEGLKSFPSGHTSWSTSGLGYTTFWLLGKLRCFDGQAQPTRFIVAVIPLLGALWIGMSRLQDHWHHVEDVACGFLLGLLVAFCFYRQIYPSVLGPHAGQLTATARQAGSKVSLSTSPSRVSLLNRNGEAAEQYSAAGYLGDEQV